jgi:hypothetical protein
VGLEVPGDLRSFLAEVAEALDRVPPGEREARFKAEDVFQSGCGYGGRDRAGDGRFRFVYFPEGRGERWILTLDERDVRAFAGGARRLLTPRIEKAERKPQRWPSGEGLLVWGRTSREAMAAGDRAELACALEALRARGAVRPQAFRLWSRMDDLLRAVVHRDRARWPWPSRAAAASGPRATPRRRRTSWSPPTWTGSACASARHFLPWSQWPRRWRPSSRAGSWRRCPRGDERAAARPARLAGRRGALHDLGPVPRGLEGTSLSPPARGPPEGATLREGDEDLAWAAACWTCWLRWS